MRHGGLSVTIKHDDWIAAFAVIMLVLAMIYSGGKRK